MVLSRETQGKLSGLQCSSQVKEEPWSLSYLTLYYIEATSVGKNPWTRLYSIALGKKLSRMSCLTKNWKRKIKAQEKFSFLAVVFTFILVYYSMHRKQTLTLKVLSLSVWKRHMDNVLSNMLWFLVSPEVVRKLDLMVIILREKKINVHLSKSWVIFVISNLPIKLALSKGERIVFCIHCM